MLRLLVIPLALLALLAGAMLWSGAAGREEAPADFVFVNRGETGTLDPRGMSWLQDIRVAYALWEGLYTLDPQTLDSVPGCSTRAEISPDGTVYTFHIRPDARWSNGDPVTAADFVFAWRRMLREPGDYTYLLHYIKGAAAYEKAFADKKPADFGAVGVEAVDAKTLRVTLEYPVEFFLDLVAFPPFFPMHEKSMEPFLDPDSGSYRKEFTHPPFLVGNGPYRLDKWEFKVRIRMVASDYYWNKPAVKSKVVDMLSFADAQTAFLKYETDPPGRPGSVDWLAEVPNDIAAGLLGKGRPDVHKFPGFGTYFYSINCNETLPDGSKNPFADVRVRQAFSMATDRKPIVERVGLLGQPEATTFVPPGLFPGYPSPHGIGYDPDRARALLAEAGYPGGKNFPRVALLFNNEGEHTVVAQVVARQWQTALNVEVDTGGVEINTFRNRLHNKDYMVARAAWIGDYNDVSTFTDKYLSDSDNNDSAWKNKRYDALCDEAAHEPGRRLKLLGMYYDPPILKEARKGRRLKLLAEAEGILCQELPIIPLYHYVNAYVYREGVTGVPLNPRNMIMLHAVEVHRAGGKANGKAAPTGDLAGPGDSGGRTR